jgi:hypothetical protein
MIHLVFPVPNPLSEHVPELLTNIQQGDGSIKISCIYQVLVGGEGAERQGRRESHEKIDKSHVYVYIYPLGTHRLFSFLLFGELAAQRPVVSTSIAHQLFACSVLTLRPADERIIQFHLSGLETDRDKYSNLVEV